jgi:hypothetical protein
MLAIKCDGKTFFSYEYAGDYIAEKEEITWTRSGNDLDIYRKKEYIETVYDITPHQYLMRLGVRYAED